MKKMIILEDNECMKNLISLLFRKHGYDVKSFSYVSDLIDNISVLNDCDLFITDFELIDSNALPVLAEIKKNNIHVKTILNSGNPTAIDEIKRAGFGNLIDVVLDKTTDFRKFF